MGMLYNDEVRMCLSTTSWMTGYEIYRHISLKRAVEGRKTFLGYLVGLFSPSLGAMLDLDPSFGGIYAALSYLEDAGEAEWRDRSHSNRKEWRLTPAGRRSQLRPYEPASTGSLSPV